MVRNTSDGLLDQTSVNLSYEIQKPPHPIRPRRFVPKPRCALLIQLLRGPMLRLSLK